MHIYIIHIHIYIIYYTRTGMHIYIIYICNHEDNVLSRLSPQRLCGNSCTWEHDIRLHIAGTNEPKNAQQAKQGA